VFTYFEEFLQRRILKDLLAILNPGGFLIIGAHEKLPEKSMELNYFKNSKIIFQKKPNRI
jgi:chemotaxis methyl-accepting protein methylase